ncbi:hypothetical protein VIVU109784_22280 [Vibrio vulnificus]|uniref:DUF6868 domain-containing protein n=1 Tax=Vibrio vulnificus (strain CMCP6) TaxID=216895 RepID=A0A3Q0MFH5_VIBVU|nr:hypothetical protein [Vibrio vulnificus]ADV91955.1 hypothetical protein VV1_3241 [Vibrio vulnificus CMCP6]QBN14182.1 hypothetical protein E2I22_08350 [Vibrio vulnificus]
MSLEQITEFLGWCTLINIVILSLSTVLVLLLKSKILSYHSKLFDISKPRLNALYFSYLGHYKVITLAFFLVPYLALKVIS